MTINDPIPENALLIDLRDEEDYRRGHLPGAVRMPVNAIPAKTEGPVLVYCYRGMRSFRAVLLLKIRGHKNVHNLGGIDRYKGKLEK